MDMGAPFLAARRYAFPFVSRLDRFSTLAFLLCDFLFALNPIYHAWWLFRKREPLIRHIHGLIPRLDTLHCGIQESPTQFRIVALFIFCTISRIDNSLRVIAVESETVGGILPSKDIRNIRMVDNACQRTVPTTPNGNVDQLPWSFGRAQSL